MATNVYVLVEPEAEPIRERLLAANTMWTAGSVHEDEQGLWLSVNNQDENGALVEAQTLIRGLCNEAGLDPSLVRTRLESYQ